LISNTSLTFYGGVGEIGENKILLEDNDTRIFIDFGKSFSRRAKFFEGYASIVQPFNSKTVSLF
jgi:mRNA degradation ribonuclease J1/J2